MRFGGFVTMRFGCFVTVRFGGCVTVRFGGCVTVSKIWGGLMRCGGFDGIWRVS